MGWGRSGQAWTWLCILGALGASDVSWGMSPGGESLVQGFPPTRNLVVGIFLGAGSKHGQKFTGAGGNPYILHMCLHIYDLLLWREWALSWGIPPLRKSAVDGSPPHGKSKHRRKFIMGWGAVWVVDVQVCMHFGTC
jgi:hypothetical protein